MKYRLKITANIQKYLDDFIVYIDVQPGENRWAYLLQELQMGYTSSLCLYYHNTLLPVYAFQMKMISFLSFSVYLF